MSRDNLSCLLYGPGQLKFEHRPVPEITDAHDAIIRITYVGVCGSDVHFWTHGGVSRKVSDEAPLVMGHEASGIVHAVGSEVTTLKPGDRVAIEPGFPCRRCKLCKAGRYNLCRGMKFAADPPSTHGTLTRLFKIPADFAYKIPDSLGLQEAVMVEPFSVAIHGVRLAGLQPGQTVLVQGSGTIGLLSAAAAVAYGAGSVMVVDINQKKLDFARTFVECKTFIPDASSTPEANAENLRAVAGLEGGFDVVLECTGVESSAQTGLFASAAGGVFVQIGMGRPKQSLPLLDMCEKETTLKTAFRYGPGDYEIALELLAAGKPSVKSLISSTSPFRDVTEAWEKTKRGEGIKNLIQVTEE
ncbi:unnamed protein product [Clonostachys solani]|uniref:L-arabinitol 4-dehydrogenase n=1 Tax=Clonostachys solani TaxID=160281 RepID=A0A9N9Z0P4_9HYPO|nr:unnamed protein product [Clonostachys solani]